jgi:pre-mRNA-splicing helicase BRR2
MEDEEISQLGTVSASLYPKVKKEGWWIVIGDTSTNTLYSLKRVTLQQSQNINLEFMAPDEAGDYNLTLFCMSDSYLGCDQEYEVLLSIAAADSDESESETEENQG